VSGRTSGGDPFEPASTLESSPSRATGPFPGSDSKEANSAQTAKRSNPLLAGEDPATSWPSDARGWLFIYRQLLEFTEHLVGRLRVDLDGHNGQDGHNGRHGSSADFVQLQRELVRLRGRVGFWEDRYRQLSAAIDIDEERGILYGDVIPIQLSLRERQLLLWLVHHPETYFTPTTLATLAWHEPALSAEQVRSYIVRLRRLLDRAHSQCRIESRRGQGYRLTFELATGTPRRLI
jgi:hypothetical protein